MATHRPRGPNSWNTLAAMRIIAGEFRRRLLRTPPDGEVVRPIPDRVKESLFAMLQGNCEDASVFDAFAGTGAIGLEAISRGAASCLFIERDRNVAKILQHNIDSLGVGDRCEVLLGDALGAGALARAPRPLTLAFLDPPYPLVREALGFKRVMAQAAALVELLADDGFLILRVPHPLTIGDVAKPEDAAGMEENEAEGSGGGAAGGGGSGGVGSTDREGKDKSADRGGRREWRKQSRDAMRDAREAVDTGDRQGTGAGKPGGAWKHVPKIVERPIKPVTADDELDADEIEMNGLDAAIDLAMKNSLEAAGGTPSQMDEIAGEGGGVEGGDEKRSRGATGAGAGLGAGGAGTPIPPNAKRSGASNRAKAERNAEHAAELDKELDANESISHEVKGQTGQASGITKPILSNADMTIPNAIGPETHIYHGMSVNLYMRKRD